MTSKQRAYLKSLASSLNPIFQVGKASLTPELTDAIAEAFHKNELIKVAVLNPTRPWSMRPLDRKSVV